MFNQNLSINNGSIQIHSFKGTWIGLVLDDKKGKNNGSINGVKYFECQENYGMFVREALLAPETPAKAAVQQIATPGKLVKPAAVTKTPAGKSISRPGKKKFFRKLV